MMRYSVDLRLKIVNFVTKGKARKEACRIFGIHINTLDKCGSLADPSHRRNFKKTNPELLLKKVAKNSGLILKGFAQIFKVSTVAIKGAFDRLKITRKKRLHATQSGINRKGNYFWQTSPNTKLKT